MDAQGQPCIADRPKAAEKGYRDVEGQLSRRRRRPKTCRWGGMRSTTAEMQQRRRKTAISSEGEFSRAPFGLNKETSKRKDGSDWMRVRADNVTLLLWLMYLLLLLLLGFGVGVRDWKEGRQQCHSSGRTRRERGGGRSHEQ